MSRIGMLTNSESQALTAIIQVSYPFLRDGIGIVLHNVTKLLEMELLEASCGIHIYHE
jgi:hypothetical protein